LKEEQEEIADGRKGALVEVEDERSMIDKMN